MFQAFRRLPRATVLLVVLHFAAACSGRPVTISADEPLKVVSQPLGSFDGEIKPLGPLPLTTTEEELRGQMVRVDTGTHIYYWMFPPEGEGPLEIKLKANPEALLPAASPGLSSPSPANAVQETNRLMRQLLQASDALSNGDQESALRISREISSAAPGLAAPRIVEGAALLQLGRRDEARAALKSAQALDPEDAKIAAMLQGL